MNEGDSEVELIRNFDSDSEEEEKKQEVDQSDDFCMELSTDPLSVERVPASVRD
jgi:hypothetical protein